MKNPINEPIFCFIVGFALMLTAVGLMALGKQLMGCILLMAGGAIGIRGRGMIDKRD